jgi:hypothetical protein
MLVSMASITSRRQVESRSALPLLLAAALLLSAGALAGALSMVQVPSSAVHGLPVDWARRSAWLAVEALAGLGIASGLMAMAGRMHNAAP